MSLEKNVKFIELNYFGFILVNWIDRKLYVMIKSKVVLCICKL